VALWRATEDVRSGKGSEVPMHLRDASYRAAKVLGHGAGYDYPHDDPRGWVPQQYRPDEVADRVYYEPSEHGFEQEVRRRMRNDEAPNGNLS
jgi:putative ATPase